MTNVFHLLRNPKSGEEQLQACLMELNGITGLTDSACRALLILYQGNGKRGSTSITSVAEKLSSHASTETFMRAIEDLAVKGWIWFSREGFGDVSVQITLTHSIELAFSCGNWKELAQSLSLPQEDESAIRIYIKSLFFHARLISRISWENECYQYLQSNGKQHAGKFKKLRKKPEILAIGIFVWLRYRFEDCACELKYLSSLFSEHPVLVNRWIASFRNSENLLYKSGFVKMEVSPSGRCYLLPTEDMAPVGDGPGSSDFSNSNSLPSSVQKLVPKAIAPCQLFYNASQKEQVSSLHKLLSDSGIKKWSASQKKLNKPSGIAILLHGFPGTGKTELARQLALESKRDLWVFDVASQRNMYYGESEKKIKEVFQQYDRSFEDIRTAPILFFNECDSVFQRRQNVSHGISSTENAVQTILLNELENFRGILICTTNRPEAFDSAFSRRFLFQMEIELPNELSRVQLLRHFFADIPVQECIKLAKEYCFTAAELEVIVKKQKIQMWFQNNAAKQPDFLGSELAQLSLNRNKSSRNPIGFIIPAVKP